MTTTTRDVAVRAVFNESRNGTDGYTRHPFARSLVYTSGISELCEAAQAFWMLDVIGSGAMPKLLAAHAKGASLGIIKLHVAKSKAVFTMTTADDEPPIWTKRVTYTDFPDGTWTLYLACDGLVAPGRVCTVLCLPSEN